MGPLARDIVMIGLMLFFLVVGVFENCISARLLLVAAIDRQLPVFLARLNRNRVPANALLFQVLLAVLYTALIFFALPALPFFEANTGVLTTEAYTVTAASLLLIWAVSFLFPFVDAALLYLRERSAFTRQLVCPRPLLLASIWVGPLVCLVTIGATLSSSWIPQLISNGQWWYLVAGLTALVLVICMVLSMLASGQASWEALASPRDQK
jgi:amino acid permease